MTGPSSLDPLLAVNMCHSRCACAGCGRIDVDTSWKHIGLEGILRGRGFKLMTIEVDHSWGRRDAQLNVSSLDTLLWLARESGYHGFFKMPCGARSSAHGSIEGGGIPSRASWLLPLSNDSAFVPTGYEVAGSGAAAKVQDVLLIRRELLKGRLRSLPDLLASDCHPSTWIGG